MSITLNSEQEKFIQTQLESGRFTDAMQVIQTALLNLQLICQKRRVNKKHLACMKCPQCNSLNIRKNGRQQEKQRFKCKDCGRIFRESHELRGYHPQVKKICLEMYLNGMGFRGIERVTGIHHTTIMNWVKESAEDLPEDEENHPPIIAELDELQTYLRRKSNKIWIWTAIDHYASGILAIQIGDRSGQTFEKL